MKDLQLAADIDCCHFLFVTGFVSTTTIGQARIQLKGQQVKSCSLSKVFRHLLVQDICKARAAFWESMQLQLHLHKCCHAGPVSISLGSVVLVKLYWCRRTAVYVGMLFSGSVSGIRCSQRRVLICRTMKLAENEDGTSSHDFDHEQVSFTS